MNEKPETYVIKYVLIYPDKKVDKEIKIKNCYSELQAQMRLDDYVKRHYPNVLEMQVLTIEVDNFFSQIFSGFKGFK